MSAIVENSDELYSTMQRWNDSELSGCFYNVNTWNTREAIANSN